MKKQHEFRPIGELVSTYSLPDLTHDDSTGETIHYDIYKVRLVTNFPSFSKTAV